MRFWYPRKKTGQGVTQPLSQPSASTSVPPEIAEDSAVTIMHERKMQHWLDQAVRDCEKNGGFEHLDGKGKPVDVPSGDALNSLLKNANVLPPWLELQHEIRDNIRTLLRKHAELNDTIPAVKSEIEAINKKISRYNTMVPTPILQKGKLRPESAREQLSKWE